MTKKFIWYIGKFDEENVGNKYFPIKAKEVEVYDTAEEAMREGKKVLDEVNEKVASSFK